MVDEHHVRAAFTHGSDTITATLVFNDSAELTDFVTDDRYQLSPDGRSMKRVRWSTPLTDYRAHDGMRLATAGSGRWPEADGDFDYIQLTIDRVEYNVNGRENAANRVRGQPNN